MPGFIVQTGWAQVAAKCCTVFTSLWVHKQLLMALGLAPTFLTCFALIIDYPFVLGHLTWKNTKFQAPRRPQQELIQTFQISVILGMCSSAFMLGKLESETLEKLTWFWRRQFGGRLAEPSKNGFLFLRSTNDKDVISKFLVTPVKAAVAQSAGSNQPFLCPCTLAGGRLSRCSCEVPKCTCWDSTSSVLVF